MTYLRRDLVSGIRNFNWCQIANTLDDTKKLASGAENWQWLNSTFVA
jgi:hypothetical protein